MIRIRRGQKGSVFTMMMATVAMVGVVGAATMNLVVGPTTTASKVTHQNMAQNDLLMNAKVVVMNASTRPQSGDEDGDGYVEPAPFIPTSDTSCAITLPTGGQGGCLPADIGAVLTDPWGTQYAYCVWDHGDVTGSTNRIDGEDSTSGAVLAIISAGPNKRFETPCLAYDGDPETNDIAINPKGVGDDLVQIYTYAAAVAGSGGLWVLKDGEPTTAVIDKKLEIGDVTAGTGFAFDTATGQGEFPYVKTDFLASKSGGSTPVTMDSNIALDGNWLSGDGGNEGIFVSANGYVGIGAEAPLFPLHIAGDRPTGTGILLDATNSNGGHQYLMFSTSDSSTIGGGKFAIHDQTLSGNLSAGSRFVIDSNGKVGIGTPSPRAALTLDVVGSLGVSGGVGGGYNVNYLEAADGVNGYGSRLRFGGAGANNNVYAIHGVGDKQVMTLNSSNGGVVINGPTNPITGVAKGTEGLSQSNSDLAGTGFVDTSWVYARAIEGDSRAGSSTIIALSDGNGYTSVDQIGLITNGITRVLVDTGGNVGIGTNSPKNLLHVAGPMRIDGRQGPVLFLGNETTSEGPPTTDGAVIQYMNTGILGSGTNDVLLFEKTDANAETTVDGGIVFSNRAGNGVRQISMVIRGNGRIGIGEIAPSHLLHVNGVARSTQASFATSSDLRVKDDIEPLADGLDTIMRLRPVNFHYKPDYAEGKQGMNGLKRGFIAQEVEAVVPEMVTQTAEDIGNGQKVEDFRILNNADFTPILVKAVQELKAENDALRAANDLLRFLECGLV